MFYEWKYVFNDITADYTTRELCKHGLIKVCSILYLTIEIELVLDSNFQVLDRSQNYRIFNVRLLSSHWNIYQSTTAYFILSHLVS